MGDRLVVGHVLFGTAVVLAADPESPHVLEDEGVHMQEVLLQLRFAGSKCLPALFVLPTLFYTAFADQPAASRALQGLNREIGTFQTREMF